MTHFTTNEIIQKISKINTIEELIMEVENISWSDLKIKASPQLQNMPEAFTKLLSLESDNCTAFVQPAHDDILNSIGNNRMATYYSHALYILPFLFRASELTTIPSLQKTIFEIILDIFYFNPDEIAFNADERKEVKLHVQQTIIAFTLRSPAFLAFIEEDEKNDLSGLTTITLDTDY